MRVNISVIEGGWPVLFLLLLVLSGCAGMQGEGSEFVMPAATVSGTGEFSNSEKAALESTGAIDKNVPDHAMEDVKREYQQLVREKRQVVCAFSRRSEPYLSYAREVFRKKGMPEELANLAIVESGYRPDAVSRAGAAGAWQFMPETGKIYGLTQDYWQDERLDPYKATEAAANYLQKLYANFGDWPTAIAAYNAGEGKMARALAGTGGSNFYEAKSRNHVLDEKAQLREETRQYVPRFLAVTKIMRNLPQLGFDPINPDTVPAMLRYEVEPGTDLQALSRACALDWRDFSAANPHHKRKISCTDRHTYVYLPSHLKEKAAAYFTSSDRKTFAGWQLAKVTLSSDSLEKIAARGKVSVAALKAANPDIGKLKVGQTLLLPPGLNMRPANLRETATKQIAAAGKIHSVKAKDTLYSIAKKYNVDVESLKKRNGIGASCQLKAGSVLNIPSSSGPVIAGSSGKLGNRKKSCYVVRAKDSLWNIARMHNISVEKLKRLNNIDEKSLKAGTRLIVAED